jgi:hypothetical protein
MRTCGPAITFRAIASLSLSLSLSLAGCGGDGGGEPSGPYFRFDLPAEPSTPVPLTGLPYPNDALLGADGTLDVTAASLGLSANADARLLTGLVTGLDRRRGFGVFTGALFPVAHLAADDELDVATLDGRVALVALPEGTEVPLELFARFDGSLHAQPRLGHVLVEGKTYAYLLRAGIATTGGDELVADPDLTALLTSATPAGPAARAAAAYAPLRAYLASASLDPATIVGATGFTTARYTPELVAARELLDARAPSRAVIDRVYHAGAELDGFLGAPADGVLGGDNPAGVVHASIAAIVLGHFAAADFTSEAPRALGRWDYDASGAPIVKGSEDVPFILTVPREGDRAALPIVVFNHGFGGSRAVVPLVADTLAARGIAVIGIDSPSHGDRYSGAHDDVHNFTGADGPDGLADPADQASQLEFLDIIGDQAHGVPALDPTVMASAFRQSAADIMSEVRLVDDGDWSALAGDFPGLGFRSDRLVYAGQSMGGILGAIVTPIDPRIDGAVLGVAGGGLLQIATEDSPWLWPTFGTILVGAVGIDLASAEPGVTPPHTDLGFMLIQTVLEEADPLTYADEMFAAPLGEPKHVALINAFSDETLPNQSSEALARALGLEWMTTARSSSGPRYIEPVPVAPAPFTGNVRAGGAAVTAGWVMLTPASHGMQTGAHGQSTYQPTFPPFDRRPAPIAFDNPIAGVQRMTAEFAETLIDTGTPRLIDPF